MKIDFSTVIFMDESQVQETFDRPDRWAKVWILSNSNVSVW